MLDIMANKDQVQDFYLEKEIQKNKLSVWKTIKSNLFNKYRNHILSHLQSQI